MPTTDQLHERWYNEFMYGKPIYADGYNVQGSLTIVGYTKGWAEIEAEMSKYRKSIHTKYVADVNRFY